MLVVFLDPSIGSVVVKTVIYLLTILVTPKSHMVTSCSRPLLEDFFSIWTSLDFTPARMVTLL